MDEICDKWDRHWQERVDRPLEPDEWLLKAAPFLPPGGRALDIACGAGRNALYLARRGFEVTAVDLSPAGLARLSAEAESLPVTTLCVDLEAESDLPNGPFDLVINFFYLQRSLLPALKAAVAPGGTAVVRTFTAAGDFPGGPENPDFVLKAGELPEIFRDWEILLHEEGLEEARRGGGLAGIVARKRG